MRNQVVFHDGFNMQFRAGETTKGCGSELLCPNQFCPKGQPPQPANADVEALLDRRQAELKTTVEPSAVSASECTVGPIAYGFDRPGGGKKFDSMKLPGGKKCSGVAMVNATGCDAEACAAMCCKNVKCLSFVHGIAAGCDQTAPFDPHAVCCWIKDSATQLTVKTGADYLSTGEVAGPTRHVGPAAGPAPAPGPPAPPAPALPKDVFVVYSTLVFTYEWPTADTPSKVTEASLRARLSELSELLSEGVISKTEHDAARQAALGI